jgi:cyclopropane-fatty-acyl-phospholipid synthase
MQLAELFVNYVQAWIPTFVVRLLVRYYIRLFVGWRMRCGDVVVQQILLDRKERKRAPVTTEVEVTNEQLYANDPAFFVAHLGPKLKYSACEWPVGCGADTKDPASCAKSLADAEDLTIASYQQKLGLAELPAGSRVLELGCGWGSLSLTNAAKYPNLNFVGFSNSPQQIGHIKDQCAKRGITNLSVFVEDYADFVDLGKSKVAPAGSAPFDAAVAIETVEHAQNIGELLEAVAKRLKKGAKFFVHSLLHQSSSYLVDLDGWMGRNFFTGGSILSLNSYCHLAPPSLHLADVLPVSGEGYAKTLLAWLALMEPQRKLFVSKYGAMFYEGFRMFYISCAEAFAANSGAECAWLPYGSSRTTLARMREEPWPPTLTNSALRSPLWHRPHRSSSLPSHRSIVPRYVWLLHIH